MRRGCGHQYYPHSRRAALSHFKSPGLCDLDLALTGRATHSEVDAKSQLQLGWGGARLAPDGGGVDKHAPWGLFFLYSLIGSAMEAEPVTCAWTLRWVLCLSEQAQSPWHADQVGINGMLQRRKRRNKFNREILLPQFSSVTQLCPTLCNPTDCSMPGFPVHHQLLEFTQTHVH